MSQVELSEEQRRAIFTPGHLQIRASAGSGKTEVLARRFVALVAGDIEGCPPLMPDRIAAITFTEKATFDMKRRIERVLNFRLELAHQDAANQPALLAHLAKAKQRLALARISTIHSFCARMLRENPLEAGVDPDFDVLDEYESRTLIERCCEELLLEALRNRSPSAIRLIEARGLRGTEHRPGALPVLVRLLGDLSRIGKNCDWLLRATAATRDAIQLEEASFTGEKTRLISLVDALVGTKGCATPPPAKIADLSDAWKEGLKSSLLRFSRDSPPDILDVLHKLVELMPSSQAKAIKGNITAVQALVNASKGGVGLRGTLVGVYGAYRARHHAVAVAQLLERIATDIEARKRIESVVTFDDLLSLTLRLLRTRPAIARRYRAGLDALLVDEYQDADRIQDAVVAALTEGADGEVSQLFIVGDEKQSIYGFRGADVTVFNRPREPKCEPLQLNENRRSVPSLIKFANLVCESTMRREDEQKEDFNPSWTTRHELKPIRKSFDEPAVELMLSAAAARGTLAKSARRIVEANAIASRCRSLIEEGVSTIDAASGQPRPLAYFDIAVVMRSMLDLRIYQRALAVAGVPNYVVKGRGFFDSQEVRDVINLLEAVEDSDHTIALAAALRSPLFGLSDRCLFDLVVRQSGETRDLGRLFADDSSRFEWLSAERDTALRALNTLRELREIRGHLSLAEVLKRALDLTDFEAVLAAQKGGQQAVANVRKLVEIGRGFDRRGYFGFRDFVRHLRSLIETEPQEPEAQILGETEDVIRLMTIHQAKGLEFPVVFLADVGRQAPRAEYDYVISDQRGLLLRDTVGSGQSEIPNYLVEEEVERGKRRAEAESARVLYVAITRARDRLVVSDLAEKQGWAKQVREIVGANVLDKFVVGAATTMEVACGGIQILLRRIDSGSTLPRPKAASPNYAQRPAEPDDVVASRFSYVPAPPGELVVSPTALAEFESCPLRYRLHYRLKVPDEMEAGSASHAGRKNRAEIGSVAHSILERIDYKASAADPMSQVEQLLKDNAFVTDLRPQDLLSIRKDLLAYLQFRDSTEMVIGSELPFFVHLSDASLSLYLRGQIDQLVSTNSGLRLRDYKYAEYGAEKLDTYKLQLECYALAASDALESEVACELVFLKNQTKVTPIEMGSKAQMREHLLEVGHKLATAIHKEEFDKKPDSVRRCEQIGCGYISRCWRKTERSGDLGASQS
jgi:ATP-dependent helicase/nuclease subunit A